MRNFRNWDVYKNARSLTVNIYKLTTEFPSSEKYVITSQIRKAAVSVTANIAEGAGRRSEKDFRHFLTMAVGSSFELEALLDIALQLDYLKENSSKYIFDDLLVVQKQLNAFISKLKQQ